MKNLLLRLLAASLLTMAAGFAASSPAAAQEMTCPEHVAVTIDVKPGDATSTIKLSSAGLTPVAVLGTADFDAALFTPEVAHLSDAAAADGCEGPTAVGWRFEDVNHDGRLDLVFFFRTRELQLSAATTAVTLMAHGAYGLTTMHIIGTDSVRVKP